MYKRILIPVDGSETSNKALVTALQMARDAGGQVQLVHVLDVSAYASGFDYTVNMIALAQEQAQEVLAGALAMAQSAGVPAEQLLEEGAGMRLGEVVANQARTWNADLIVVGTHGRRGVGRVLLGSGAEQVIRMAPVPVLVIPSEHRLVPN